MEAALDQIMLERREEVDEFVEREISNQHSQENQSKLDTSCTTLPMLLEVVKDSDIDFVQTCQKAGLIATRLTCCEIPMDLNYTRCRDGLDWHCKRCHKDRCLRKFTFFADMDIKIKEAILVLYCWSRCYPEALCQNELSLNIKSVEAIYDKCKKICLDFFKSRLSAFARLGGRNKTIYIDCFEYNDKFILAGIDKSNDFVFFDFIVPNSKTEIITSLVDNVESGELKICNQQISELLGDDGREYLSKTWDISVIETTDEHSNLDAIFRTTFVNNENESDIKEYYFRQIMNMNPDPFQFLIGCIAYLYPPDEN